VWEVFILTITHNFQISVIYVYVYIYKNIYYRGKYIYIYKHVGQDSTVGILPHYRVDDPGIESQWAEIFRTHPDQPWDQASLLYNGYQVHPRAKAAGAWH